MLLKRGPAVTEWNGHFIREISPIYQVPKSRTGRAHQFAPVKLLGPLSIDTYWFDLCIIWLASMVFYVALQYDLLRKFVHWNQIRKLRKSL